MDKYNLLDCTLRDGGYINNWNYDDEAISDIIHNLILAGLDFIEVGYLNAEGKIKDSTQFNSIEKIQKYIPTDRKNSILLAMADVKQFGVNEITEYSGASIDGIRIVFYKYQINEAMELAKVVQANGYKLFMQPMVTIDYTVDEYADLVQKIAKLKPYAVSIVDSFGYMLKEDFRKYFRILDNLLDKDVVVGFHSHNNMNLAFITAQDILEYNTMRRIVIDSSLYGIGRGAGNLNTELIANYYNMTLGSKYDIKLILDLIGRQIMPIYSRKTWGYSPYLFITGLYHYHPNYACYLLEEHPEITVAQFAEFMETVPEEMKTRCKKQYVLQEWDRFIQDR